MEKDYLEQTFKLNQFDLTSEDDLLHLVSENFIQEAMDRFESMDQSLVKAIKQA